MSQISVNRHVTPQRAFEISPSSGGSTTSSALSGYGIQTFRSGAAKLERANRATIMNRVLKRCTGKEGLFTKPARNIAAYLHRQTRKGNSRVARKVSRMQKNGSDVGTELVTTVVAPLSPLQVALAIRQMKSAAVMFQNGPEYHKEARQKMLLGLSDVGAFLYSASSLTNPIGLAVAFVLTTGLKVANLISNLFMKGRATEDKDRLKKAASRLAEKPFVKPLLNFLLRFTFKMDTGLSDCVKGLKENFASDATKDERKRGKHLLAAFHKQYSHYYPDAQAEKRETMSNFLADKNDSWNLHTLEKNGKVIGGFTCFHLNDDKYGKQLYVEQLIPPFHKDALLNAATWEYIRKLAQDTGSKRIWLEIPASERLPADFKELDIFYAQPTLTNKQTAPVSLHGRGVEAPIDVLRMSVLTIDGSKPGPSYNEFQKIIVDGCVADWANKNDPAWLKLKMNPRNDGVIPVVAGSI